MRIADFTELILNGGGWFLVGITVYYLLTFMKVHLIWKIQERVWISSFEKDIFSEEWKSFFYYFFKRKYIHQGTFSYLFKYKAELFRILNHGFTSNLKSRIIFLEALTFFLKPFVFCALAFFLLRCWIASEFFYEELKITLGEVQILIDRLNSYKLIQFLKSWKFWIFFIFSISIILIPRKYIQEGSKGDLKSKMFLIINIFLIVLNISFFGAKLGEKADTSKAELIEFKHSILALHYEIIKDLTCEIFVRTIGNELAIEESKQNQEYDRFQKITEKKEDFELDNDIRNVLYYNLGKRLEELSMLRFNVRKFQFNSENIRYKNRHGKKAKSDFLSDFFTNVKDPNFFGNSNSYIKNRKTWNLELGQSLSNYQKKVIKINKLGKYHQKLKEIFDIILQNGIAAFVDGVFNTDVIDLESQVTAKKIISIWSAKKMRLYCYSKLNKIVDFISDFKKGAKELNNTEYCYADKDLDFKREQNDDFVNQQRTNARAEFWGRIKEKNKEIQGFKNTVIKMVEDEMIKINKEVESENQSRLIKGLENKEKVKLFSHDQKMEVVKSIMDQYNFNKMKLNDIKELAKTFNFQNKFQSVIRTTRSLHPGPLETCPICNYSKVKSIIDHKK